MRLDIVFVLIGTTHAGNLGATARAMKTMGFDRLRLVDSCSHRSQDAIARASGAADVLDRAEIFATLEPAIEDCHQVIGSSARARQLAVPLQSVREIADALRARSQGTETRSETIAVLFGPERSGLSNEAIDRCTRLLRIPCNPDFSSLNLGSAVQVVAYELSQALESVPHGPPLPGPGKWKPDLDRDASTEQPRDAPTVTSADMERFFDHLDTVMLDSGFLDPANPKLLDRRLRRYFERTRPEPSELAILRGLLSAFQRHLPNRPQR